MALLVNEWLFYICYVIIKLNLVIFIVLFYFFNRFPAHRDLHQEVRVLKEADNSSKEEIEKEQQEILVEQDDPDEIARQRAMDDFKDENKRGWGNRYNRS